MYKAIPFITTGLFLSTHTTVKVMATITTSTTARTTPVTTTGIRNGCWAVLTVGATEVVATVVIVVVTVGAIVVVTVGAIVVAVGG